MLQKKGINTFTKKSKEYKLDRKKSEEMNSLRQIGEIKQTSYLPQNEKKEDDNQIRKINYW